MRFISSYPRLRDTVLQAFLLLALLVVLFPGFFFRGELIVPGDILFQSPPWDHYAPAGFERPQNRVMVDVVTAFTPYYAISKGAVEAGEWPLWNPLEYLGMPLLANVQSAVFYPPRLVHYLFSLYVGMSVYILLKLWLCGMTAFVCARGLGLRIGTCRFFSVAWMLAPYNVLWANWALTDVAAWLPLVFLGAEWLVQAQYRRGFFMLALGGSLMLLAGHPETAFAMALGVGLYFLTRLAFERYWGRRLVLPIAAAAGAWAMALLLFAGVLLPFAEYLLHSSTFFHRAEGEAVLPLPPGALATFFVPRFYGTFAELNYWGTDWFTSHPYMMIYPGLAIWLGASLLLAPGEARQAHKRRIAALLLASLLGILMAYDGPIGEWFNELPVFRSMFVFYHVTFTVFVLPLLAAFGIENWFSRPRKVRELAAVLAVAAPAVAIVAMAYRFNEGIIPEVKVGPYLHEQMLRAAVFAALSFVPLAAYVFWRRPAVLLTALGLVFAADILVATRGMNPTLEPRYVYPGTKLTRFLQSLEKPARVGTGEGYVASGLMPVYGIEELLGYDGLYPGRIMRLLEAVKNDTKAWEALAPALSVEYYLYNPHGPLLFPLKEQPDRFEFLGDYDGLHVYRDKGAFGRAYLLPEARVVKDVDEMVEMLAAGEVDVSRVALLEEPLPQPLADTPLEGSQVRVVSHTYTHALVEVETPRPAVLVLADAYYPGWKAYIDDRPAESFPVFHVLRGVVVPEGQHRVTYRYSPWSLRLGVGISVVTALVSCGYVLVIVLRRRR